MNIASEWKAGVLYWFDNSAGEGLTCIGTCRSETFLKGKFFKNGTLFKKIV